MAAWRMAWDCTTRSCRRRSSSRQARRASPKLLLLDITVSAPMLRPLRCGATPWISGNVVAASELTHQLTVRPEAADHLYDLYQDTHCKSLLAIIEGQSQCYKKLQGGLVLGTACRCADIHLLLIAHRGMAATPLHNYKISALIASIDAWLTSMPP